MKEFKLPEKWAVKITSENREALKKWAQGQPDYNAIFHEFTIGDYVVSEWPDGSYQCWDDSESPVGHTEITFEQFKKYVLKEETMGRKIIGYKLKDKGNEFFAVKMVQVRANDKSAKTFKELTGLNEEYDFQSGSLAYNTFNDIGLLNEWFEPVYEEPEFKVGDWAVLVENKYNSSNSIGYCGQIVEQMVEKVNLRTIFRVKVFGGRDTANWSLGTDLRHATTEEIKAALLAEAARRYPVGTKIKSPESGLIYVIDSDYFGWSSNFNSIFCDVPSVYFKGKWAKVIAEAPKIKKPKITINSYTGEFFSDCVKFGCATIDKDMFIELDRFLAGDSYSGNRKIESVTIGIGSFTKNQIKKIAEYYLSLEG